MKCKNCGAEFEEGVFCPECGAICSDVSISMDSAENGINNSAVNSVEYSNEFKPDPSWPTREKKKLLLLTFLLGGFGAHWFYLGNYKKGIIYFLICISGISYILSFIDGVKFLSMDKLTFMTTYKVRLE